RMSPKSLRRKVNSLAVAQATPLLALRPPRFSFLFDFTGDSLLQVSKPSHNEPIASASGKTISEFSPFQPSRRFFLHLWEGVPASSQNILQDSISYPS